MAVQEANTLSDVSVIIAQIQSGDPTAADKLLPLVYDELRKLASAKLALERPGHTLQATALVHEAFIRLVSASQNQSGGSCSKWDGRGHFFAAAAESMRRILVENARRKGRAKRGGGLIRQELGDVPDIRLDVREDLMALDAALDRLSELNRQAVELVQLRYFAGLSLKESAEVLDVSTRTAGRLWAYARAWLHQEISKDEVNPKKS
jgi:RNA polymerase sigma factor (TIGR02999 family)